MRCLSRRAHRSPYKAGDTPLHVAVRSGAIDAARLLLLQLRIPWHAVNARGETCADVAAQAAAVRPAASASHGVLPMDTLVSGVLGAVRRGDPAEAPEHEWVELRARNRGALGQLAGPDSAVDRLMAFPGWGACLGFMCRAGAAATSLPSPTTRADGPRGVKRAVLACVRAVLL